MTPRSVYMLLIMVWLFASCSEHPEPTLQDANQTAIVMLPKDSILIQQTELNSIPTDNIGNTNTQNHLYTANLQQHVAKEAPVTIQEMALKSENLSSFSDHHPENKVFFIPKIRESSWQLRLLFQNDIFTNTDYYFTNGANIAFTTALANKGFHRLLFGLKKKVQVSFSGFSITQNIYTPTNPDINQILQNDRPFAGYLTFGQFRETYSPQNKIILKSRIEFGVLGPASFGGQVQSSIHQIEPIGWDNQIRNMPVINYFFLVEKGLVNQPHAEINLTGSVAAGTAYNQLSPGLYLRLGQFTPVLKDEAALAYNYSNYHPFQYWFFIHAENKVVLYNATLQGSMFNNNDPYTIPANKINRMVPKIQAGIALYYHRLGVECSAYYLAPEFDHAKDFKWGSFKLIYLF